MLRNVRLKFWAVLNVISIAVIMVMQQLVHFGITMGRDHVNRQECEMIVLLVLYVDWSFDNILHSEIVILKPFYRVVPIKSSAFNTSVKAELHYLENKQWSITVSGWTYKSWAFCCLILTLPQLHLIPTTGSIGTLEISLLFHQVLFFECLQQS